MRQAFLPEDFAGGFRSWRLVVIHYVAKALGVLVKVDGFPYGSSRNVELVGGCCENPAANGADQRFKPIDPMDQIVWRPAGPNTQTEQERP